jgi:hypothetical protein
MKYSRDSRANIATIGSGGSCSVRPEVRKLAFEGSPITMGLPSLIMPATAGNHGQRKCQLTSDLNSGHRTWTSNVNIELEH